MDSMTPAQRHRCMSHIRSKNTKPELKVRKWLWSHGYRYRLNVKSVPGKPDIVMRPYRTAIFVNGCFWHGHNVEIENSKLRIDDSECCRIPHTNREFWVNKIRRNQNRDRDNYRVLQENGWRVIVVWECQLKSAVIEKTMCGVEMLLNENLLSLYKKPKSVAYVEEAAPLPLAAEEESEWDQDFGKD